MTVRTWGQHPVDIGLEFQAAGLSRDARTLFLILPMTSRILPCGLLELSERRWATECAMTLAEVETALNELASTERASTGGTWIVIDWDTVELLIPSHVRSDGSLKNPKHVKGIWNAVEKITSAALRQVVLDRIAEIPGFPPPAGPSDRASDCPIDRPNDPTMDSPGALSPEPGTSSSSSARTAPTDPLPAVDDDDQANGDLVHQRARAACELIGARDYERAVADQVPINHHGRYLAACVGHATSAWLGDAVLAAERWPDLEPAQLADHVDPSTNLDAAAPHGPAPPRPHLDPKLLEDHLGETDSGALVVDLAAVRASAAARAGTE